MSRFPIPFVFLALACAHVEAPPPEVEMAEVVIQVAGAKKITTCPESGIVPIRGPVEDAAEAFVQTMEACKGRPVAVDIDSRGGALGAAIDMQKAIERHDALVVCVVDGMAASAAFFTLQACPIRAMTSRSTLMAHGAATMTAGQSQQLLNRASMLQAIDRSMALFCAKRMGMAPETYEARVSGGKEWWMTLEEGILSNAVDIEVPNASFIAQRLAAIAPQSQDGGTP